MKSFEELQCLFTTIVSQGIDAQLIPEARGDYIIPAGTPHMY